MYFPGGETDNKRGGKLWKEKRQSQTQTREGIREGGQMDAVWRKEVQSGLTRDGAEVEVVSDDLLVIVVHRALGEAQVEVVP